MQVVRHKRSGYRGVIYRWDRICKYPQYMTHTDVDFVQPFYSIIPGHAAGIDDGRRD